MLSEDKIIFVCTRQKYLKQHADKTLEICDSADSLDWDYIYSTSKSHKVESLVYRNLIADKDHTKLDIPENIRNQFLLTYKQNIARSLERTEKIKDLLLYLKKESIEVMFLKGTAINLLNVYEKPWYTSSDDVDLLLNTFEEDLTDDQKDEIPRYFKELPWCEWELHEHHDVNMNNILPINFNQIWKDALKVKLDQFDVNIMSPDDMLISVCINSCRKRYFNLKSLCDISEIAEKSDDLNLNWEDMVRKSFEYKCHDIVYAALSVAKATLDCNIPDYAMESLAEKSKKIKLIHFIIKLNLSFNSLDSFSNLTTSKKIGDKKLGLSNILPIITLNYSQAWNKWKMTMVNNLPFRRGSASLDMN